MEVHRDLVVGVDARGHDDIDLGHLRRDRRDARDGATQAHDGEVDQRVDTVTLEVPESGHGALPFRLLVPFVSSFLDLRAEHEDVLVHEGGAEPVALDRSEHGVDLPHRSPLPAPARRMVAAGPRRPEWRRGEMSQHGHSGRCVSVETSVVR